jgi:hypothetical protein
MDNSWDNSNTYPRAAEGSGLSRTSIGIAVAMVVILICFGGAFWSVKHRARIEVWENQHAEADWSDARKVVDDLFTDEGAKAIYRNNPKLADRFQSDLNFLNTVAKWRTSLTRLPAAVPTAESKRLVHRVGIGDSVAYIKYEMDNGHRLVMLWDAPSMKPQRHLTDIEVR